MWERQAVDVAISVTRGVVNGFTLELLGPAGASVSPTPAERAGIVAGVRKEFCDQPVVCAKLRLSRIRLSKTDRRWAAANYAAPGTQSGYAVLHREGTQWRVVDYGTADVGCSSAPAKALYDLGIYCGH